MAEFLTYLRLGFEHISDLNGYDHILFIAALCASYQMRDWKELLWLVTAFTVGHSVTLALATLDLIRINADLVEFLIPLTIFITAVIDIAAEDRRIREQPKRLKYSIALGFGLIHGLGFSNYLRSVLFADESIFLPLLGFNIGLELGQILILFAILLLGWLIIRFARMQPRDWTLVLAGAAAGIALTMMLERL